MEEEIIPTSVPGVHIRRDELVRVMLDTLQSMGYRSTAASLERESGLDAATDGSAALRMLRSEVVDGRWSNAIGILLTREAKLASKLEEPVILFAILRQMYLETIESGGTWEALSILREQVQPLLAFIAEICGRPPHRPAAEEMGAGGKRSLFGAKAALSFPASPVFAPLAMPLPHTLSPVNALTTTSKAQRHAHAPTRPGSGSIAVVTATEARQPAGGAPSPPVNVGALFHQAQQLEEATEEEEAESSVQERGVAGPFRVKVKSGAGAGAGGSGGMVVEAGRGEELMSQAGASAGDREDLGLYCLAEPARTTTTAAPTGGTGLQQTADTDAVFSSGRAKRQRIDDIVSIATCGGTIRLSRSEYTKAAAAADASGGGTSLPFDEREREYLGLSSSVTSSSLATGWPAYSALSRPSTLHSLAALTLITDPQQLREAARWSGAKGDSRLALLYLLERRLHPSTVPPLRLPALLGQAVAWQRSLCPLHNDWDGTPSLLRDHVCAKSEVLPSRCVAVLQGHEEEVWGVKLSPDGTLAASYAKDGSVVVWALEAILKAASQAEVQQHWQIEKEEEGGSRAAAFNGQDHRMTEEAADGTPLPRPEASSSTYAVLRISAGADGVSSVGVGTLPRLSMMEPPASSRGTAARSHEGEEGDTAGSGDGTASAASAGRIGGTTYPSGGNGGVHPWTGGLSSRPVLSRWDVKEAPDVLARTGRPQAPPVEVDSSPSADAMTSLAWSSDGSMILTTGTSTTCAYLWAVRTGKLLAAFDAGRENVKGGLSGAAWVGQPSGGDGEAAAHRRFVASAVGGSVWLWSVPTEVVAEAHNPSIGYKPVLVSRPQAQWMTGPTWGLSVALFPKPQTSTGLGATAAAATGAATAAGNGEATATPSLSVFDTVAVLGQEGVLTIINTRDHSAPMLEQSVAVCGYKVTAATMDHTGRYALLACLAEPPPPPPKPGTMPTAPASQQQQQQAAGGARAGSLAGMAAGATGAQAAALALEAGARGSLALRSVPAPLTLSSRHMHIAGSPPHGYGGSSGWGLSGYGGSSRSSHDPRNPTVTAASTTGSHDTAAGLGGGPAASLTTLLRSLFGVPHATPRGGSSGRGLQQQATSSSSTLLYEEDSGSESEASPLPTSEAPAHVEQLVLWDLVSAAPVALYRGHRNGHYAIAPVFGGPHQALVACGSEDAAVYVWHREQGGVVAVLRGHAGPITALAWSPVHTAVCITASDDKTVRIWA